MDPITLYKVPGEEDTSTSIVALNFLSSSVARGSPSLM